MESINLLKNPFGHSQISVGTVTSDRKTKLSVR